MDGLGARRNRLQHSIWLLVVLLCGVATRPVYAEGWELGGHLKYQYTVTDYAADNIAGLYGVDTTQDHFLDTRLKAEWRKSGFDFTAHYELLGLAGDSLATRRNLFGLGLPTGGSVTGLPDDRRRLFNLTDVLVDENRAAAVQRLDRFAVGYSSSTVTVRFGRQAVSWGNGLAFQVLDFVNPFAPLAIDKDYKTGEDLLYGQWQWSERGDVQLLCLPRRDLGSHDIDREQGSRAVKVHARAGLFDFDLLVARHYDQTLLGAGAVKSLGGAVWRVDALHTDLPGREGVWSWVTNLDYSWILLGKNMYGFVEYYRNGFGANHESGYLAPDPELAARLARGELYTLARDYAALGVQVELAPLFSVFASLLQNLDDGSRMLQLRGVYDWRQNVQFQAGVNLPGGERGSEYGGIPVLNTSPPPLTLGTAGPGRSLYLRAGYYF